MLQFGVESSDKRTTIMHQIGNHNDEDDVFFNDKA